MTGTLGSYRFGQRAGFAGGLIFAIGMMAVEPPVGLAQPAWNAAAVGILLAIWWMTEALPIPVTSLLPVVLFPLLGITSLRDAAAPYAHPLIFLFMGGFMLSIAMQRWNLHKRIALHIIRRRGSGLRGIISGFMIASAFLSLWVTNTATTLMLLPVALSVIAIVVTDAGDEATAAFSTALLLGIAYSATIGGLGTLIGTVPNALLAAFMEQTYSVDLSFTRWMMVGIPLVIVGIPVVYWVLTRLVFKIEAGRDSAIDIDTMIDELGPLTKAEKLISGVWVVTAAAWITRPLLQNWIPELSDPGIALAAAISLFIIPVRFSDGVFLMDWKSASRIPWGTLILFGGGLSLAAAISTTGLAAWIGAGVTVLHTLPMIVILLIVVTVIVFLTELTSNTATAAAFLPILAPVAIAMGQNPLLLLLPATLAASCAFMLPVATPPNAIIFGSERVTIAQMSRAGLLLNFAFIILVALVAYALIPFVFDVEVDVIPDWAQ